MKKIAIVLVIALAACAKKAETPAVMKPAPVASASAGSLTGTVEETIDAAGYTYVRVKTASGDQWAAVTQTPLTKGATVTINAQMTAEKFESKTLHRTFDRVVFGTIAGSAPASSPRERMSSPDTGNVNVPKATASDAKTIAELHAEKSLKDAPVTVSGKVVKYLPGIMGRNWIHIRDGSGPDDLTVTTTDTAAVGDVITAHGTVRRDKDFGAGYSYAVIVEDAKVTK